MCVYGDPAYPLRVHSQGPFRGAVLTQQQIDFNRSMSATRISVEWTFGDIVNYFKFLDFKTKMKHLSKCSGQNVFSVCHSAKCS